MVADLFGCLQVVRYLLDLAFRCCLLPPGRGLGVVTGVCWRLMLCGWLALLNYSFVALCFVCGLAVGGVLPQFVVYVVCSTCCVSCLIVLVIAVD